MSGLMLTIGQVAKQLGVAVVTVRRWHREGKLVPAVRTCGGHRRYAPEQLVAGEAEATSDQGVTLCYARVSCADQKKDLERQGDRLMAHAKAQGWAAELVTDVGSGMNCAKRGLKAVVRGLLSGRVRRLVIEHKDRLLRFGADLVFLLCRHRGVEVVVTGQTAEPSFEERLAADVLELMTVFSARLYGARSKGRRKVVAGVA